MANYFNYFPKVPYIKTLKSDLDLLTNIITRVKFLDDVKNKVGSYFTYDNSGAESPENLALRFYDSVERHWIILLFNDVIDPFYDWYKSDLVMGKYIDQKYSNIVPNKTGTEYALTTVKNYYIVENRTINFSDGAKTKTETIEVTKNIYDNFSPSSRTLVLTNSNNIVVEIKKEKKTRTIYDYEIEQNEKRRSIRILEKIYVDRVERELARLVRA